jgi:plastocyanin
MIGERIQAVWNALLDLIGRLIAPDWGWLVSILPLLIGLLVGVGFVYMLWLRTANAVWNVSRVPRPRRSPPPPAGLHLPGPSLWPFLLPLGAAIMIGGLIFKPGRTAPPSVEPGTGAPIVAAPASPLDLVNVPLLVIGFVIVMVGIIGWYRDANRELRRVEEGEAGGHAHEPAAEQLTAGLETSAVVPTPAHEAPAGVHLPGPSPWPFFAPIALAFTLFGLLISPALLLGGIVMCVIAVAGWYRDARREYTFVEVGEAPEPRTRDPERAFPKMLLGAFVLIGLASVAVAALPLVLGGATAGPSPSASASGGGGVPATKVTITAVGIKFTPTQVTVAANQPITITFDNRDSVQHNIAIFAGADASAPLVFRGTVFAGPKTMDYSVPAMAPGSYYFHCDVHPTMTGTITAK